MTSKDFAALPGPVEYALPAQWPEVFERYAFLGAPKRLEQVRDHADRLGARRLLLEHQYIDADYRNEYAHFFVRTFRWLPDRCERLHLWNAEDIYLGYCTIRPVRGAPVGRSMLPPVGDDAEHVACLATATAHPYGQMLEVEAFPFISQDQRYGRCAHAVIWMISHFHWLINGGRRWFMSDIVEGASSREYERLSPSAGLTEEQIGATFRHVGLSALHYAPEDAPSRELLVVSYMNSRVPLGLGVGEDHFTALIGCGFDDDRNLFGITSDDERAPYCRATPRPDAEEWTSLWVPLPGRIYMRAEEAHSLAEAFFASVARLPEETLGAADATVREAGQHKTRVRVYVEDVRRYKEKLCSGRAAGLPADVVSGHLLTSSSRWIWVGELQDVERAEASEPCVLAEVAFDATSSYEAPHTLFANYPGISLRWNADGDLPGIAENPDYGVTLYGTGTALGI